MANITRIVDESQISGSIPDRVKELHRIRPSIISGLVPRFLWGEVKKNFLPRTGIAKATRTDRAALKMFHSKNIIQHLIGDVKGLAREREVV